MKVKLFPLTEEEIETSLDDIPALLKEQLKLLEKIEIHQQTEQQIIDDRSGIPAKIKLKNLWDQLRHNKLKPESKNAIKDLRASWIKSVCGLEYIFAGLNWTN